MFKWEILGIRLDFFYFHEILAIVSSCLHRNGILLSEYQRGNAVHGVSAKLGQNLEALRLCEGSWDIAQEAAPQSPEPPFLASLPCDGQHLTSESGWTVICTQ